MSRVAPDWDALAPVWHCLETGGLTRAAIGQAMAWLTPPVVFVGGGRGVVPSRLVRWFGHPEVTIVDSSRAMARRARQDFGLQYVVVDVRALPLRCACTGSAVCSTGVLEYLDDAGRIRAIRELSRVARSVVVLAWTNAPAFGVASELESWLRAGAEARTSAGHPMLWGAYDAVASVLGSRVAAYDLLASSWPAPSAPRGDSIVNSVAAAGLVIDESLPTSSGVTLMRARPGDPLPEPPRPEMPAR